MKELWIYIISIVMFFVVGAMAYTPVALADFVPDVPDLTADDCGTPELKAVCGDSDPTKALLNQVITWVLGIAGTVIVIFIVVSGIQMASSAGSPDALKKAKSHLIAAITSLILLVAMGAILALLGINLT